MMLATSARLSHDQHDGLLVTLYADEGSSICAVLHARIIADLAQRLLDEDRRRAAARVLSAVIDNGAG
jgi:hypothetical protein